MSLIPSNRPLYSAALALAGLFFITPLTQAATYDVSTIPTKNTGDAFTAAEVNLMVDMLRNLGKDDMGDTDVTNDRFGINVVGTPSQILEVGGNVEATGFIGDGSQLTNLPNPGYWTQTASDIYYDTGKVAIGINTSPTLDFEIHNAAGVAAGGVFTGTGQHARWHLTNANQEWLLVTGSTNEFGIINSTGSFTPFEIDPTTNNIGIRTADPNITPAAALHVNGDIRADNFVDNVTGLPIGGGKWQDGTGTDEIHYSAANVGIGITDPTQELDVAGNVRVREHMSVGANASGSSTMVLRVDEDYSADESRYLIRTEGTASGNTTGTKYFYGNYTDINSTQEETSGNVYVRGIYGRARTAGSATYNTLQGVYGVAYNDSAAGSGLGSIRGVQGEAYNNDTVATLGSAYGILTSARGKSTLPAGPVSNLYGAYLQAQAYEAQVTNAYGAYGYVRTVNGDTGDITTAQAVRGRVYVDSDDGGDIGTAYGGYFNTARRAGANLMTAATGVYADPNDAVTAYGGRFYADDADATTNYGIITNAQNATNNNYAIWTEGGDWVMDTDGDGSVGGTVGGDIILGEGNDFRLYHNGTNSHIANYTGDVIVSGTNSLDLQLGTSGTGQSHYFTLGKGFGSDSGIEWERASVVDTRIYSDANEDLIFAIDETDALPANEIIFQADGGAELMRIEDTGDVGIGTSTPDHPLEIYTQTDGDGLEITNVNDTARRMQMDVNGTQAYITTSGADLHIEPAYRTFYRSVGGAWSGQHVFGTRSNMTYGTSSSSFISATNTWAPTSGSGDFTALVIQPTVNQSGTASGNYTGLEVRVNETNANGTDNQLLNLNTDGSTKFKVESDGDVTANGTIMAVGSQAATQGSMGFGIHYSGANVINTFGSQHSSATTTIGYGVKPKSGSAGFVSSAGNAAFSKGALEVHGNYLSWKNAGAATVAIDADVTMTERFRVGSTGTVTFGDYLQRSSGNWRCPVGEVLVGFDDGTDGNNGLLCEPPPQIYQ